MYKKIFLRILISALLVLACLVLIVSNFRFCEITLQRYIAIEDSYYGWHEATNDLYNDSIRRMNEFSEEGDYQKWLVSSGDTYTGKIVRGIAMLTTLALCLCSAYVCIGNVVGLFWRINRDIKRHMRKIADTRKAS